MDDAPSNLSKRAKVDANEYKTFFVFVYLTIFCIINRSKNQKKASG